MPIMNDPIKSESDDDLTSNRPNGVMQEHDSESSDEDMNEDGGGYELLPQEPPQDEDEIEEDFPVDFERNLPEQPVPSGSFERMFEEGESQRRTEEAQERIQIHQHSDSSRDIALTEDKVAQIKTAMSNFKLPSVPVWASEVSEQDWKALQSKVMKK